MVGIGSERSGHLRGEAGQLSLSGGPGERARTQLASTRREPEALDHPGTQREGGRTVSRVTLPDDLAEHFTIVEQLATGGEGFVLRVQNRERENFVAKIYRAGLRFDPRAMLLLAAARQDHVAEILDSGTDELDGSRWELLKWYPDGSLADLMSSGAPLDLGEVLVEITSALEHVHDLKLPDHPEARLVHQDIKPENILVRERAPLDLVLGDVGLARTIEGDRHLTDRQDGTRAWAPPLGEAITPAWDWWSVGMIMATLSAGRHPFEVDGEMLSVAAISDLLSQGPVDLSGIEDPRTSLLCRGLLTRKTDDRWGAHEVREWLSGGSPRVTSDKGTLGGRRRSVHYDSKEYDDTVALARAFQQTWDLAVQSVAQRADQRVVAELRAILVHEDKPGALRALDSSASQFSPPVILANLLIEMDPDLPPLYRSLDMRPAAVLQRLTSEANAEEVARIEHAQHGYLAVGVLTLWRHLEGMSDGPKTERQLRHARDIIVQHDSVLERLGPGADIAKTAMYLAALDLGAAQHQVSELAGLDRELVHSQKWWQVIAEGEPDPILAALAVHAYPMAVETTHREDEAVRQQAAQAARAREDEQRREEQQAAEEREQRRRSATAERRRHTEKLLGRWWLVLLVLGLVATPLGVLVLWASAFPTEFREQFFRPRDVWFADLRHAHLDSALAMWDPYVISREGGVAQFIFGALLLAAGVMLCILGGMSYRRAGIAENGNLRQEVKRTLIMCVVVVTAGTVLLWPWAAMVVSAIALGLLGCGFILVAGWIGMNWS